MRKSKFGSFWYLKLNEENSVSKFQIDRPLSGHTKLTGSFSSILKWFVHTILCILPSKKCLANTSTLRRAREDQTFHEKKLSLTFSLDRCEFLVLVSPVFALLFLPFGSKLPSPRAKNTIYTQDFLGFLLIRPWFMNPGCPIFEGRVKQPGLLCSIIEIDIIGKDKSFHEIVPNFKSVHRLSENQYGRFLWAGARRK